MNGSIFRWTSHNAALLVFLLVACDPFKEDTVPLLVVNSSATDYYILPNTSTVIDLKALVNSTFTSATIRVSENPTKGILTSLDEFLLEYDPHANFMEGKDQFQVSISNNGVPLKTEILTIHMKNDTTDFPCTLYAVEDNVNTRSDSIISIKFLSNDRICGFTKLEIQTSIYSQPKNGQAKLVGDSIIYTPRKGYIGNDSMIYKITAGSNLRTTGNTGLHDSYGLIFIRSNKEDCRFILQDFYVLDLTDTVEDLFGEGECAGGYQIMTYIIHFISTKIGMHHFM